MDIVAEWVEFEIPFLIQVEDSFDGNEHTRFQVERNDIPAEFQFEKQVREEEGRPGSMFGLVEGERLGNVSYTKVRIGFAQPFINSLDEEYQSSFEKITEGGQARLISSLESREGYIIKEAVNYLNLFLDRYRASFDYYWIRQLKPSEIAYFTLHSVAEDGSEHKHGVMYAQDGLTPGSVTLDEQQYKILQSRLHDNHEIPAPVSLELDAKDKLDLGEYRLCVILSETMFESFLKTNLRQIMEAEGKSPEEIENAFRRGDGDYKGIVRVAKDAHKTLHFDFEGTDEYENWRQKTRDVRNDVVHDGYMPTDNEARKALNAASNAIELLSEEMAERAEELE